MSYTAIQGLLDNHLLTLTGLPTLQLENTRNVATTGQSYSRATLLPAQSTQLTVGVTGLDRLSGLYQVDIVCPQDAGTTTVGALADLVIEHYPRGLLLTDGSVTVHITRVWREAGFRVNPHYQIPAMIQWYCIS